MNSPSTEAVVDALRAMARIARELGLGEAEAAQSAGAQEKAQEKVTA